LLFRAALLNGQLSTRLPLVDIGSGIRLND